MATILVIEDDMDIQELVRYNLERAGHRVVSAYDGESGLDQAKRLRPDLVLLDLMLPKLNGYAVCRQLKATPECAATPVVMMTARGEEGNIVKGLDLGAHDYITKPFSINVLLARVRAALRSEDPAGIAQIRIGPLLYDPQSRQVATGSEEIRLTPTEGKLLALLASAPGRVFSREQLLDAARGLDAESGPRAVDVQILGLRRKLGEHGHLVETVRGSGYRLNI